MSADTRETFLRTVEDGRPDLALLDRLADSQDVIPDPFCDMLAVTRGSTYAQAAGLLKAREAGHRGD